MDIKITDSWLRDYLKTDATPNEIAQLVSLSGPSFEKITKVDRETVYSIEVTSNRVDAASVIGIAREAAAVLPQSKKTAQLVSPRTKDLIFRPRIKGLDVNVLEDVGDRFLAMIIDKVKVTDGPPTVIERLKAIGVRPVNNVVDVTNYLMYELGQPMHAFDYDKIKRHTLNITLSRKDEIVKTLDGQTVKLPGGDIVVKDGKHGGKIIDLCGIMGAENTKIDKDTKTVVLLVPVYKGTLVRRTSMRIAKRSEASGYFEKNVDGTNARQALMRAAFLFEIMGASPRSRALEKIVKKHPLEQIIMDPYFISERLGVVISNKEILKYLEKLGFEASIKREMLHVIPPLGRASDIKIPEDIVEEIARMYGYTNIPNSLPSGALPVMEVNDLFKFEYRIKQALANLGGTEIYTSSLVSKEMTNGDTLSLKNPLGADSICLRNELTPSLVSALTQNTNEPHATFIFEIANTYIPTKTGLPTEINKLGCAFINMDYRHAKGVIEAFYESLSIKETPSLSMVSGFWTFEKEIDWLMEHSNKVHLIKSVPKYPSQIEDLTIIFNKDTLYKEVASLIKQTSKLIHSIELVDIFKDAYTLRIEYRDPEKTLEDKEVTAVRTKIISRLKKEFDLLVK